MENLARSPADAAPVKLSLPEQVIPVAARSLDLQLQLAERLERIRFPQGHLIFCEGAAGDAAYMIVEGFVQIFITGDSGTIVLAKLGPGELFGEQALLTERARTASARARTDVTLLKLDKERLSTLLHGNREMLEMKGRREARLKGLLQAGGLQTLFADGDDVPQERVFSDGSVVFREGDDPDGTYLILSGAADVLKHHGDTVLQVCRLVPGNIFGEKAVVEGTKRAATICARGELRVWFASNDRVLDVCRRNPTIAQYFASLARLYQLPRRGMVTQYTEVTDDGRHAVVTIYDLSDGRRVVARQESDRFSAERVDPAVESSTSWRRVSSDVPGASPDIWLTAGGEIVKLSAETSWDGRGAVFEMLLDRKRVSEADSNALLSPPPSESLRLPAAGPAETTDDAIVCRCLSVSAGAIRRAISAGSRSLEALQQSLGCGTVCGGCKPNILEMTGLAAWAGVRIEKETRLGDVGIFSLRPIDTQPRASLPGQHVVVRAHIDGVPVQRPYTLTNGGTGGSTYEIAVKKEPSGTFSSWLLDRRPAGCALEVSWPGGDFVWDPGTSDDVVVVVAGIGVTPAVAFVRAKLQQRMKGRLLVLYSVRGRDGAPFVDEIAEAAGRDEDVRFICRDTTRDGRITAAEIAGLAKEYARARFFVCGPQRFNADMHTLLREAGIPAQAINVEAFVHQGDPVPVVAAAEPRALPPTPPGRLPLLGHIGVLTSPLFFFLLSQHRRMGPIFRVGLGPTTATVLAGNEATIFFLEHPELFSQEHTFRVVSRAFKASRAVITMDGPDHQCLRGAVAPSFESTRLTPSLYSGILAAIDRFADGRTPGERLWASPKLTRLSITVANLITHRRLPSAEEIETGVRLRHSMRLEFSTTQPTYHPWLPYTAYLRNRAASMAERIMHETQAGGDEETLISRLSKATREHDVLRGSMLIPFTVGQDSSAGTLEFLLFSIYRDPDLPALIARDVAELFASGEVTTTRLGQMRCLRSVVYETLRRFPFFPALPVTATREFEFAGYRVKAGGLVLFSHPITNFLPEFFPEPFEFRWDRFLDEEPNPRTLRTFGAGPHTCVARDVVPLILTIVAARLVHRLELTVASPELRYKRRPFLELHGRPLVVKRVKPLEESPGALSCSRSARRPGRDP
jgi:ferredoxin-NADP reductase/cytochrome P450/CRP-like cAMP-binding protein/bacterioferritin-associated ferredoxin